MKNLSCHIVLKALVMTFSLLVFPLSACSQTPDKATLAGFKYEGSAIPDMSDEMDNWDNHDNRYWTAYWNPAPGKISRPGFHIAFWGSAEGCSKPVLNGPTARNVQVEPKKPGSQIGPLVFQGKSASRVYTPVPDVSLCAPDSTVGLTPRSYVAIDESGNSGEGIKLFSYAGKDKRATGFAFLPHPSTGGRAGANADIIGTFTTFRFAAGGNPVRPWADDGSLNIQTVQGVTSAQVAEDSPPDTQVKQQIIVTFINQPCLKSVANSPTKCHLQMLFNTAILRQGLKDWRDRPQFKDAAVFFDPAQGGIPVLRGHLGDKGEPTSLNDKSGKTFVAWKSAGTATFNGKGGQGNFALSMTFDQFLKILDHIASSEKRTPVTDGIARLYGDRWNDPNAWSLLSVRFAQEVHNRNLSKPAFIEGYMKSIVIQ